MSALTPVPTDPCALAGLIAHEHNDLSLGRSFPDLFSRLKAQEGYASATQIWGGACFWLDRTESEED
jgi:hypothetical protein